MMPTSLRAIPYILASALLVLSMSSCSSEAPDNAALIAYLKSTWGITVTDFEGEVSVAADGSAWGVNNNDEIFRWNGGDWDQINGGLHQVAHRSRERVWGVSADDQIWYVDP